MHGISNDEDQTGYLMQLRAPVHHVKVKVMDETDFGGSHFVDAKQSSDDCEYTHQLEKICILVVTYILNLNHLL